MIVIVLLENVMVQQVFVLNVKIIIMLIHLIKRNVKLVIIIVHLQNVMEKQVIAHNVNQVGIQKIQQVLLVQHVIQIV